MKTPAVEHPSLPSRPRISVAMATYNGARYISEQMVSLAAQSWLPDELVVSDDGSSDDTIAVIERFAETAPFPVRILPRGERLGFADNFLRAATACSGDLIALCDQDDAWEPTKLAIGARRIIEDGSLLSMHPLIVVNEAMKPTGLIWTQGITADRVYEPLELDPYNNGWGNTMLFRRELLTLIPAGTRPPKPESPQHPLSHDTWLYVQAAALGRVSHITEPLIHYRQHSSNVAGVKAYGRIQRLFWPFLVPMAKYRERALFYQRMALLFEKLSMDQHSFVGPSAARTAADRFAERHDRLIHRIALFGDPSISSRYRAFRALGRMKPGDPVRRGGRLKELGLGVSGLSRIAARAAGLAGSRK